MEPLLINAVVKYRQERTVLETEQVALTLIPDPAADHSSWSPSTGSPAMMFSIVMTPEAASDLLIGTALVVALETEDEEGSL